MNVKDIPGLESLKVMEEMIQKGLDLSARLLNEELLAEYENMSDGLKCAIDCEGIAAVALTGMYKTLLEHKKLIERLRDSGLPLGELKKKKTESFLRLVSDKEQKELN